MIDLDPSIINQDSIRKKRRKKLLATAAIPVIIVIAASAFFLRPGIFNVLYNLNFNNDNAGFNIFISRLQTKINILEPYIAHYDAGTAYIKDNDGKNAEVELRESLRSNPPSDKVCQVRTNLSYSIEMQADQKSILEHYSEALVLYSTAEGVLYGDNCADKNRSAESDKEANKSRDKKAEAARERISQKRGKITSKMNGQSEDDQDPDKYNDTQINEGQLQELRSNLMNGIDMQNHARQRQFSSSGGLGEGSGGGSFSNIQHW